jgi:predicted nucleic acid-binding protein
MATRALVVDANILIRAALGNRVRLIIETHAEAVSFFVPEPVYEEAESHLAALALQRIGARDPDDWPVPACALALGCPIWTEDTDFFGCGVATWTSNRVEMFLCD